MAERSQNHHTSPDESESPATWATEAAAVRPAERPAPERPGSLDDTAPRVLIVDDDPSVRRLLRAVLAFDHALEEASTGEEALEKLPEFAPGVVLLDIMMPGIDGHETCRRIKHGPHGVGVQVIVVSANSSREEQIRAFEAGADDYLVKPFDPQDLRSRVRLHFQLRGAVGRVTDIRSQITSHNSQVKQLAAQRAREIIATQDVAVFALAKLAESRDQETAGHLTRMRAYSQLLAEELAQTGPYTGYIDQPFLDDLYRSSPLHDVGKVGIRDEILLKPGPLTDDEFAIMQQHVVIGANILDEAVLGTPCGGFLAMASLIARFHHERFDGKGYLAGLVGTEIPLCARIVAVADVYDALTSVRPYKAACSPQHALEIIDFDSGRHFDPAVVQALHARWHDFLRVQREHAGDFLLTNGAMSFREFDSAQLALGALGSPGLA